MIAVLAIALTLTGGARSPHEAVQRFIQNRSPADACAQLAPAYRATIAKQYGPCLSGMKATQIVVSHQRIIGKKATVDAAYAANGSHFRERYTLARTGIVWLITGSKQI